MPMVSLSTILNDLYSFMLEDCKSKNGRSGSIKASSATRKKLAKESGKFNLEKIPIFIQLFPGKRKIFNRGTIDSLLISNV